MIEVAATRAVEQNGSAQHVLALDIGGTKLAAGVVDTAGGVRSFIVESTQAEEGPERGLERLFALGRSAVEESGVAWPAIGAVGIGAGGPSTRPAVS